MSSSPPEGQSGVDDTGARAKKVTTAFYKRTREEALEFVNTLPVHEMFDLDTGSAKRSCQRDRSPSPPSGTLVYEVGTGRPYEYTKGSSTRRLYPDSVAMANARKAAFEASTASGSDAATSGGGLRRVKPVPRIGGETVTAVTGTRANAIEKVLHWQTSSFPKPLDESVAEIDTCPCIALVGYDEVPADTAPQPESTEGAKEEGGAEAMTLNLLRRGYRRYLIGGRLTPNGHRLTAYSCRSPRTKLFHVYKSITCTPDAETNQPDCFTYLPVSVKTIQRYLDVFFKLVDYDHCLWTPFKYALVLDKIWKYDPVRKIHLPLYQLLEGDVWTGFTINTIQESVVRQYNREVKIRRVRFLSTPNTLLYTNQSSLAQYRPVESPGGDEREEAFVVRTANRSGTDDVGSEPDRTRNPTLVIVKASQDEMEPDTASCTILAELHLGDEIQY